MNKGRLDRIAELHKRIHEEEKQAHTRMLVSKNEYPISTPKQLVRVTLAIHPAPNAGRCPLCGAVVSVRRGDGWWSAETECHHLVCNSGRGESTPQETLSSPRSWQGCGEYQWGWSNGWPLWSQKYQSVIHHDTTPDRTIVYVLVDK